MFKKDTSELTADDVQNIEEITELETGHLVTEKERKDTVRKEWRPYYEAQLAELTQTMEKRYGSPLDKKVVKKLKAAAKVCAKNRFIIESKYGK